MATDVSIRRGIAQAIREGRSVSFVYKGTRRTVEPHALGHPGGARQALLRAFQTGGKSGDGWRMFSVSKIRSGSLRLGDPSSSRTASLTTAEGLALSDTETITNTAIVQVLSSIKIDFATPKAPVQK